MDKDMYICFRYQKEGGSIMYSCIQESKLYGDMPFDDSDFVYFDMDDYVVEKMIDMLRRLKT